MNPQQAFDLSLPSLSSKRQQLIVELREILQAIQNRPDVEKATVFEAIAIPPDSVEEGSIVAARRARNDLAILQGVFIFNYFLGDSSNCDRLVNTWEYTAGWFAQESNLDNSTLLQPLEGNSSSYIVINNARWDSLAPVLQSLRKPSFKEYVMANIAAEGAVAMPVLYRLAI